MGAARQLPNARYKYGKAGIERYWYRGKVSGKGFVYSIGRRGRSTPKGKGSTWDETVDIGIRVGDKSRQVKIRF